MCVAYEGDDGTRYDHVPYHQSVLHKVRPVYETLPGWGTEIETAARFEELPARGARLRAVHRGVHRRARELRRCRSRRAIRPSSCPARRELVSTRVLVVGGGGREHALAWGSRAVAARSTTVVCRARQPGHGERWASASRSTARDPGAVAALADELDADLVVVGPEDPLVAGVVDALADARPARVRSAARPRPGSRARRRG